MTPQRPAVLLLGIMLFAAGAIGQTNSRQAIKKVLQKGVVDSLFVFGKWTKDNADEIHLKYLGQVNANSGRIFKVVNSTWFWGLSHRATSRIIIFNAKNQYIGDYYLTTIDDLPTKLENGNLIFNNTGEDCDKKLVTVINLKKGLPKEFFRKCRGNLGDIYSFAQNL